MVYLDFLVVNMARRMQHRVRVALWKEFKRKSIVLLKFHYLLEACVMVQWKNWSFS